MHQAGLLGVFYKLFLYNRNLSIIPRPPTITCNDCVSGMARTEHERRSDGAQGHNHHKYPYCAPQCKAHDNSGIFTGRLGPQHAIGPFRHKNAAVMWYGLLNSFITMCYGLTAQLTLRKPACPAADHLIQDFSALTNNKLSSRRATTVLANTLAVK